MFVRKKDGELRWCLDYRDQNDVTMKDAFGIPKISPVCGVFVSVQVFELSGYVF